MYIGRGTRLYTQICMHAYTCWKYTRSLNNHQFYEYIQITVSLVQASLVASDRLFGMKCQILEGFGLTSPQAFPITTEGMPLQMVAYLRLARLQDPGEFAKVLPPQP